MWKDEHAERTHGYVVPGTDLFQIHFGLMGTLIKISPPYPFELFQIHFGLMGTQPYN
jgi:hypothetical protein